MLTNEIKLDSSDFSHFCSPTWPHFIKFPKIQSSRRKIHSREVKTEHPEERFFKDDLFYTGSFIVCGVYSDLLIYREKVRIMGMGGEGVVYSNYVVGQKVSLLCTYIVS